jgi:large subunit ribosomal protein L25
MEAIAFDCVRREAGSKGVARRHRADGRLPAVLYGHGITEPVCLSADPIQVKKGLENPKGFNAVFHLKFEGQTVPVMVRDIQRDAISRDILHVDFVAPDLDKPLVAVVPVDLTGKSIGVATGGRLRKPYREVKLRSKPYDVPAQVLIDITTLDQGDEIRASTMPLPEGVEPVFDRDYLVVKVLKPRGKVKTDEPAAAAKKKK